MAFTHSIRLGGRLTALFVGGQGSGKTVAAASFPGPIMFYDFDGRMDPVKAYYPDRMDIEYKVVSAYDAPPNRHDVINFRQFCDEFESLQQRCDYATVVIDSITSYTATVVRWCLNRKAKEKRKGKRLGDFIEVPTWDEFNAECQAVVETIEIAKILPCHVIFTAHPIDKTEIIKKGEGEGNETVRRSQSITAFGNKTPSFVPNYFNEIYNFVKVSKGEGYDPDRHVLTQAGDDTLCKTSLRLPPMLDITNKGLFKVLNGILEERRQALAKSREELEAVVATEGQAGAA